MTKSVLVPNEYAVFETTGVSVVVVVVDVGVVVVVVVVTSQLS